MANAQNFPPPSLQHSNNEPPPPRYTVNQNGDPIDARTHIVTAQQQRDRETTNINLGSSLAQAGLECFGPMIRGEPYASNFRDPRDIEKYNPDVDPGVWADAYLLAMGFTG